MENANYDPKTYRSNDELELAEHFIRFTDRHIFLTGKAGTGKTTFLHRLISLLDKRMIVVAPTGVAAINAGGMTIHSFFQLSFGPYIPVDYVDNNESSTSSTSKKPIRKLSKEKRNIIRSMDLLIIDEVSMVRADLLDSIDEVLRRFRGNPEPFGGVQLLMIGDIHQLAPVVRDDDWSILRNYYNTAYFFGSRALAKAKFISIELSQVFRQKDDSFIKLLNAIRDNKISKAVFEEINKRFVPGFNPDEKEGYINLCSHNYQAQQINDKKMNALTGESVYFKAEIDGIFPASLQPLGEEIELKIGAQVMFVKNDLSSVKRYFNGKTGLIVRITDDEIDVQCPKEDRAIVVERSVWENNEFVLNPKTKEIEEDVIGTYTQFPLKAAWAITIHKSQGLTFDRAIIDAQKAFAHGQVYVALSRCRSLAGLVLSSPLQASSIIADRTVNKFSQDAKENSPDEDELQQAKRAYLEKLVRALFSFTEIGKNLKHMIIYSEKRKSTLAADIISLLFEMDTHFNTHIAQVALTFKKQLNRLFEQESTIEYSEVFQQRIAKAAIYFGSKLVIFKSQLISLAIESDNSSVQKEMRDLKTNLSKILNLKIACLKTAENGFDLNAYQKTRALGSIEVAKGNQKKEKGKEIGSADVDNPKLYIELKAWREEKYQTLNLTHYRILTQKSLVDLSNILPQDKATLKLVHGIGKRKIEKYGDELVQLISEYCTKNKIKNKTVNISGKKKIVANTKLQTFKMYSQGKSVSEIAAERGYIETTIALHLAHFIEIGELEVAAFVNEKKVHAIIDQFKKIGHEALSPVKTALGESYSYAELRYVQAHYLCHLKNK